MKSKNGAHSQVAAYCRLALADDAGMEEHRRLMRRFAEERGAIGLTEYIDNGASGLALDRLGFNRMCEAIRTGAVKTVLVRDMARIGRDMLLVSRWLDEMAMLGVTVITVQ